MRTGSLAVAAILCLGFGMVSAPAAAQSGDWLDQIWKTLGSQQTANNLSQSEIVAGLKEALANGTTNAIKTLGKTGGFWDNPAVRIPLPGPLQQVGSIARQLGQGAQVDAFQLSLNRAAEKAVPQVADLFGAAIRKMTLSDAQGILTGGDHAATDYFRRTAGPALAARIEPIVAKATSSVGVTEKYKQFMAGGAGGQLSAALSLLGGGGSSNSTLDLDRYVTDQTLNGLFYEIGKEEAAIRKDPAARTTDLLKKVFAGQ